MTGLSVLIVDDEPLARRRIVRLLARIDWVGDIGEAANVDDAAARMTDCPPDILLLDIQMPGGDGFELIERLPGAAPAIVFVTAFDHHAVRAFALNAVDYITKPIEPGRFHLALDRARGVVEAGRRSDRLAELQETVASLKRALGDRPRHATEFWVKSQGEYLRIAAEEIIRFQADRDYVRLHVHDADFLYQESLASLERRLDPDEFVRVHRGTIVRRRAILRIKPAPFASLVLMLTDGSEARVGRTYTPAVRAGIVNAP